LEVLVDKGGKFLTDKYMQVIQEIMELLPLAAVEGVVVVAVVLQEELAVLVVKMELLLSLEEVDKL
jgi:hypothetical protein